MATTPKVTPRVSAELIDAARARAGDPGVPVAVLVRAGLLLLAGIAPSVKEALASAHTRPGPKPRERADA